MFDTLSFYFGFHIGFVSFSFCDVGWFTVGVFLSLNASFPLILYSL